MSSPPERTNLRVQIFPLGQEPGDDLSAVTTAAERLAMVWTLSVEAWTLSGGSMPNYQRHDMPVAWMPLARGKE